MTAAGRHAPSQLDLHYVIRHSDGIVSLATPWKQHGFMNNASSVLYRRSERQMRPFASPRWAKNALSDL